MTLSLFLLGYKLVTMLLKSIGLWLRADRTYQFTQNVATVSAELCTSSESTAEHTDARMCNGTEYLSVPEGFPKTACNDDIQTHHPHRKFWIENFRYPVKLKTSKTLHLFVVFYCTVRMTKQKVLFLPIKQHFLYIISFEHIICDYLLSSLGCVLVSWLGNYFNTNSLEPRWHCEFWGRFHRSVRWLHQFCHRTWGDSFIHDNKEQIS